ncbi:MAG: septum formation initiator family protein [Candidatus Shapirobacteria bacterium]|nr:septum formation initiator family protein [Candidatus Shapirobacteria bacterium]
MIFAIISLSQNTIGLINRGLIIRREQQSLEQLKADNQRLKARLDYIKTEDFLEQEARDSLGLTKEESILILPSNFVFDGKEEDQNNAGLSCWRQWWDLFFKFD